MSQVGGYLFLEGHHGEEATTTATTIVSFDVDANLSHLKDPSRTSFSLEQKVVSTT